MGTVLGEEDDDDVPSGEKGEKGENGKGSPVLSWPSTWLMDYSLGPTAVRASNSSFKFGLTEACRRIGSLPLLGRWLLEKCVMAVHGLMEIMRGRFGSW